MIDQTGCPPIAIACTSALTAAIRIPNSDAMPLPANSPLLVHGRLRSIFASLWRQR
jgi:hypothetical protein